MGVAPAYDILPMRYASIGAGVDPDLVPITPRVGSIGANPSVWAAATEAARQFWTAVRTEELPAPISSEMRELAVANLRVVLDFVEPLVPARG